MKPLFIFFFLSSIVVFGQEQESETFLKYRDNPKYNAGSLIDRTGKEVGGLIYKEGGKNSVKFIHLSGEKKTYHPNQIDGFIVSGYRHMSDGKTFLKVTTEGNKVLLHKETVMRGGGSIPAAGGGAPTFMPGREEEICMIKKVSGGDWITVSRLFFKAQMTSFFADCAELQDKIKEGELGYKDIDQIAYLYESKCP